MVPCLGEEEASGSTRRCFVLSDENVTRTKRRSFWTVTIMSSITIYLSLRKISFKAEKKKKKRTCLKSINFSDTKSTLCLCHGLWACFKDDSSCWSFSLKPMQNMDDPSIRLQSRLSKSSNYQNGSVTWPGLPAKHAFSLTNLLLLRVDCRHVIYQFLMRKSN